MLVNSFPRRWIPSVLFKGLAEFRTPPFDNAGYAPAYALSNTIPKILIYW